MARINLDPKTVTTKLLPQHKDIKDFLVKIDKGEIDYVDDKSEFMRACMRMAIDNQQLLKRYIKIPEPQLSIEELLKSG